MPLPSLWRDNDKSNKSNFNADCFPKLRGESLGYGLHPVGLTSASEVSGPKRECS